VRVIGAENSNLLNEPADRERNKKKHYNCKLMHNVAPIVISEVPHIAQATLIARDPFR
jgi:hypothetical protein